jgi:hypothetical protein
MRLLLAALCGVAAAAVGGLIMGEYPFRRFTPYVAGVLFGLVVSELLVAVAGRESVLVGVVSALCAGAGLAYAVWDDSGYGVRPIGVSAWASVAIGVVVAGGRGGWWQWVRKRPAQSGVQAVNEASTAQPESDTTSPTIEPSSRPKP